jgi:hypothetical protein
VAYSDIPTVDTEHDLETFVAAVKRRRINSPEDLLSLSAEFAALAANKTLIVSHLERTLRDWRTFGLQNDYTGQTFILHSDADFYIRANIWLPVASEDVGTEQYFYDVAHDHNFSFMTAGYAGPGYQTEIFEYDGLKRAPKLGEKVDVRFLENTSLHEGKIMVYRASRDIHIQHPPTDFTISLNMILAKPDEASRRQCLFDPRSWEVTSQPTGAPVALDQLFRIALLAGGERGATLVSDLAKAHPNGTVRDIAATTLGWRLTA